MGIHERGGEVVRGEEVGDEGAEAEEVARLVVAAGMAGEAGKRARRGEGVERAWGGGVGEDEFEDGVQEAVVDVDQVGVPGGEFVAAGGAHGCLVVGGAGRNSI